MIPYYYYYFILLVLIVCHTPPINGDSLVIPPARCDDLAGIAKDSDPSGFETLTVQEYYKLWKKDPHASRESCNSSQHRDGIDTLLKKVVLVQEETSALYHKHAMGIKTIMGEIFSSSTGSSSLRKRPRGDKEGLAKLAQEYDAERARVVLEKYHSGSVDTGNNDGQTTTKNTVQTRSVQVLEQSVKRALRACKNGILKMFSLGGFAYYIRLHEFIIHGATAPKSPFTMLAVIYRVATLQSEYLDQETDDEIIRGHVSNKRIEPSEEGEVGVNALTLGGGPAGRWSTLLAFRLAGFNVMNVEKYARDEYLRKRTIRLDSIWVEQLRWFLGRIFDEALRAPAGEYPIIHVDKQKHSIHIDIFQLEWLLAKRIDALRERIKKLQLKGALAAWVKLEVKEKAEVDRVLFPGAGADKKLCYRAVILEEGKSEHFEEFRLMLNAGGANNKIRNLYNGVPVPQTWPQAFFIAVVDRSTGAKIVPFTADRFHITERYVDLPSYDEFRLFFKANEVNDIIAEFAERPSSSSSPLPNDGSEECEVCRATRTMETYGKLGDLFAAVAGDEKIYAMAIMNQRDGIRVVGMPPELLENFSNSLRSEMEEYGWDKESAEGRPCYVMRNRVVTYFFAAVFRVIGLKNSDLHKRKADERDFINVDHRGIILKGDEFFLRLGETNLNKQLFNLILSLLPNGADFYYVYGQAAIFKVVSDGVANPHFASTNGMTTARRGIENGIEILRIHYPKRGKLTKEKAKEISSLLNKVALDPVKADTFKKGSEVMKALGGFIISNEKEKDSLAKENTLKFINSLSKEPVWQANDAETGKRESPEVEMFGFELHCTIDEKEKAKGVCVNAEHPQFELRLHDVTGGERVVDAKVTEQGQIGRRFQKQYNFRGGWDLFGSVGKTATFATEYPYVPKPLDVY